MPMPDGRSVQVLVLIHLPEHVVGAPVEAVQRVVGDPRNIAALAHEVHRLLAQPEASLDLLIARLEAERKAAARATAPPSEFAWPARPTPHP